MSLKIYWHSLSFPCPTCKQQGTITNVEMARDGDIRITGVCIFCGKELTMKDTLVNIIANCAIDDHKRNHNQSHNEKLDEILHAIPFEGSADN